MCHRWGRSLGAVGGASGAGGASGVTRGAGWRRGGTRTSLDLALDLRAQHTRLHDLRSEIANLTTLKKR